MSRRDELLDYADTVKGFMPRDEGLALFEFALAHGERSHRGTWLEIGAWCGKSAVYLGAAAEATKRTRPAGSTSTRRSSIRVTVDSIRSRRGSARFPTRSWSRR